MKSIVVSDTSPLQYLILIQCIDVLPVIFDRVLTTPQVIEELSQPKTPPAVRQWISKRPSCLVIETPTRIRFEKVLDSGEASAISLALEQKADAVLIDERDGREIARRSNIRTIGTLWILIEAGVQELIDFDKSIERLIYDTSFFVSKEVIATARRTYNQRRRDSGGRHSDA